MGSLNRIKNFAELAVIKILPVRRNRFVFSSFDGHYSDSPKKISEVLHQRDSNVEQVWLINEKYSNNVPDYAKAIRINSFKALFYRGTAEVLIDNVYGNKGTVLAGDSKVRKTVFKLETFLRNKKKQKLYTTWHGTPLKRMGRHIFGSKEIDFTCTNGTMILENQYTIDIMKYLTFDKMRMLLMGCPRNDALVKIKSDEVERAKEVTGLPKEKKIILYAPTFRSDGDGVSDKNIYRSGINQLNDIDFDKLFKVLSEKFGGEWVFVSRFHYHVEKMVDWEELERKYPNQIINGNTHDDMSDYLLCSDVLITDASSCMFDFSLARKPSFLLFPDLDYYKNEERGFYCELETLPFSVSKDVDGLLENIKNFDAQNFNKDVDKMFNELGYIQDGKSTEKIVDLILEEKRSKR